MIPRSLLAATFALAFAGFAHAQDIGGDYNVSGTNLDGSAYSGTASVTLLSETTCEITWQTGSSASKGICMRSGNVFAAGYVLGDDIGLVIYELRSDGSLEGTWTAAGRDGSGTETLTPK